MVTELNNHKYTFILFLLLGIAQGVASCSSDKSKRENQELMEFKFINKDLDSLSNLVKKYDTKDSIATLILFEKKDTMYFCFSLERKDDVKKRLIDQHNYRTIGYVEKPKTEYLLLTNINEHLYMKWRLKDFIEPVYNYKEFDYIYHSPIDSTTWNHEAANDAVNYFVKYVDGKIDSIYIDYEPTNDGLPSTSY